MGKAKKGCSGVLAGPQGVLTWCQVNSRAFQRGFQRSSSGSHSEVFQGVWKIFQEVSKHFRRISEALQRRFREFRKVSGVLHEVQGGFKGISDAFQAFRHPETETPIIPLKRP